MKRIFIFTIVAAAFLLSDVTAAFAQSGVVTSSSVIVTRTKIKKERKPIEIRWQNSIDVTVTEHGQVSYTGGWRFGNFLYLGFGAGAQVYPKVLPWDENGELKLNTNEEGAYTSEDFWDGYYSAARIAVPLYANVKFRFFKTMVSPYLSASGGALFYGGYASSGSGHGSTYSGYLYKDGVVECTYYAEAMIGVDFRLKNNSNISLGLGPIWTGQPGNEPTPTNEVFYSRAIGGFKLGYSF